MLMLLCYLGAPAAPHPFLSWYCQGYQPDSGMWLSQVAERGWPAVSRMAALPSGSQGQRSAGGPPCSSATGWWELGRPRPHSAAGLCHQDTLTLTQSEQPPSVGLRGDEKRKGFLIKSNITIYINQKVLYHNTVYSDSLWGVLELGHIMQQQSPARKWISFQQNIYSYWPDFH